MKSRSNLAVDPSMSGSVYALTVELPENVAEDFLRQHLKSEEEGGN